MTIGLAAPVSWEDLLAVISEWDGNRLAEIMAARGLSQTDLARLTGYSQAAISRWVKARPGKRAVESRVPSVTHVWKFCDVLKIHPNTFREPVGAHIDWIEPPTEVRGPRKAGRPRKQPDDETE